MTLELQVLVDGDTEYISKHNSNYSQIQNQVNPALEDITALKQSTFFANALDYRLLARNFLVNGAFDYWQRGATSRPDAWTNSGLTVSRSTEQVRINTYSAKTVGSGTLFQKLYENIRLSLLATVTFSFGCWVYSDTADIARVGIFNGVTTTYSTYHTGGGTWQFLFIPFVTGSSSPSELRFVLSNEGGTVFFNAAMVIRGNPGSGPIFIINDTTTEELRVLGIYETGSEVVSGVGVKIGINREITIRVRFLSPKLEIPTVDVTNLDTGYDYNIFDISRFGFSLTIIELGDVSGTDGFIVDDIDWIAEVTSV